MNSVKNSSQETGLLQNTAKWTKFFSGLRTGLPIAIGYIPIAIAFGLLAKAAGLPNYVGMLMSFIIFAGASQFVGVNLLALGAGFSEIILTTFILNLRHFLMSASIAQRIETSATKKWLALLSFGLTDETFAVAALQKEPHLSRQFILGLNLMAFSAWNFGTWIGLFLADGIPEALKLSMGIALYVMFIGLLVPSMKKSRQVMIISILAMGIHSALHWLNFIHMSTGWMIIIATVVSALIGAVIFNKEDCQE